MSFWNNSQNTNICIMAVPEQERKQEVENLFEKIMTENFPKLVKKINIKVLDLQGVQNKMNTKRPTARHVITKMSKVKEKRVVKAKGKHLVTYKGADSHKTVS